MGSEVDALKEHKTSLATHFGPADDWSQKFPSEIDVDVFNGWLDQEKEWVKTIEHDCRDAKRRVNLQKGPRPKTANTADEAEANHSEEDTP